MTKRKASKPHITRITSKDQITPNYCILLGKVAKVATTILPEPFIGSRRMEIIANKLLRWAQGDQHDVDEIYDDACLMARTLLQYRWAEDFAQGTLQAGLHYRGNTDD